MSVDILRCIYTQYSVRERTPVMISAWRPTVRYFENEEKMSRPESSVPLFMNYCYYRHFIKEVLPEVHFEVFANSDKVQNNFYSTV